MYLTAQLVDLYGFVHLLLNGKLLHPLPFVTFVLSMIFVICRWLTIIHEKLSKTVWIVTLNSIFSFFVAWHVTSSLNPGLNTQARLKPLLLGFRSTAMIKIALSWMPGDVFTNKGILGISFWWSFKLLASHHIWLSRGLPDSPGQVSKDPWRQVRSKYFFAEIRFFLFKVKFKLT